MSSSKSPEFNIPLSVITKIIAETISDEVNVQEDFIKALSRATSLFILNTTAKASELASDHNRRTVYSQDILDAISQLGFGHLTSELLNWHAHYLEEMANLKNQKKKDENDDVKSDEAVGD